MACVLNASTTSGFVHGADTSGVIALQNNGTTYATGNQYGIGLGTAVPSSGIGLAFPATQSASSDANTLDDYEEGSWTPVIDSSTAGTGRATTVNSARYTKVGNLCYVYCYVNLGTLGSGGAGQIIVKGLPFTSVSSSSNGLQGISVGYFDTFKANLVFISAFVSDNNTQVQIEGMAAAGTGTTALTFSTYAQAGMTLILGGCYQTA